MFRDELIDYTDWYLRAGHISESHGCRVEGDKHIKIRVSECERALFLAQSLYDVCHSLIDNEDFRVELYGVYFRGHVIHSVSGTIITLRQMNPKVMSLDELGMPEKIKRKVLAKSPLKNGLLLVGGAQGQGKSTTVASILKARLEAYGGHALTVENPIEMPLDGWHSEGICIQTQIDSHMSFADGVRGAMRSYPVGQQGILMIGEIRDAETATEACVAAVNGLLVIATIHANNPLDIFYRMESLAKSQISPDEARSLVSAGFRMLIHQEMFRGKVTMTTLNTSSSVVPHIKSGRYERLSTELCSQNL